MDTSILATLSDRNVNAKPTVSSSLGRQSVSFNAIEIVSRQGNSLLIDASAKPMLNGISIPMSVSVCQIIVSIQIVRIAKRQ